MLLTYIPQITFHKLSLFFLLGRIFVHIPVPCKLDHDNSIDNEGRDVCHQHDGVLCLLQGGEYP